MGAQQSARSPADQTTGFVTVSSPQSPQGLDRDTAALHRLPPCAPLIRPIHVTSVRGFFSSKQDNGLPKMPAGGVASACREFATFSREGALPLCETQKVLGKKITSTEALCTRILYVMALRAGELSSCAASLHDLTSLSAQIAEANERLLQCTAKADALLLLLPEASRLELAGVA